MKKKGFSLDNKYIIILWAIAGLATISTSIKGDNRVDLVSYLCVWFCLMMNLVIHYFMEGNED